MGDRYTLPASWGGIEVEVVTRSTHSGRGFEEELTGCYAVGGRPADMIWVNPALLTPVAPPLPPEPPDRSRVGISLGAVRTFERDDEAAASNNRGVFRWWGSGTICEYDWPTICEMAKPGVPVLLVPDPFAE